MRKVILAFLFLSICAVLPGCGETLSGVGKDVNRMGRGASTFFFRQP
jgi:predicted small secreted protein